ncbi:MAG: SUMF1/EgtB/PvdO family nonheme iron enzyme [Planctomycetes bacterium]|nr:SUMF1/EgtB/PvdO family nonheme iron enzyme [Planctomycetota bacterium]
MSTEPDAGGDAGAIRVAFYQRYLEDLERGRVQPLEAYQALFPGYDGLIAREHAKLAGSRDEAPTAAEGARALQSAAPADEVEGYRLLEVLGEGGMGTVWRALQERPLEREVALKVVKLGMDTREVVARFESERRALALLDHPGIAKVFEARATRGGRPCFSMELVRGAPITRFADERRLSVGERLRLFLDVCDAVQHAHQKGIIHRDLKPSNVLVAERDGRPAPKVIDFGIAKSLDRRLSEASLQTEVGQVLGTLEYMSPEQAVLGGLDVDTRADIYSLGVILHELLTGELPLGREELRSAGFTEALRRIAEVEPPRPSMRLRQLGGDLERAAAARRTDGRALLGSLRSDLDWVAMKALAKDRERRYSSVSELAADIRRHLAHEPVLAGPPGAAYRLRKFARRNRTALAATAAAVLVLAASVAGAFQVAARRNERRRVERSLDHLRAGEEARARFEEGKREAGELERAWKEAFEKRSGAEPVWALGEEIEGWRAWQAALEALPRRFNEAALAFTNAREAAPPGSPELARARDLLSELHWRRFEEVYWLGQEAVKPEYVAGLIQSLGDSRYLERLRLGGRVRLESRPSGARVRCFRYELVEGRLFPLAFAPAGVDGLPEGRGVGEPYLAVERVWDRGAPFEAGDRIVSAGGRKVSLLEDLVEALAGASPGAEVEVEVLRGGERRSIAWAPASGVSSMDDFRVKLGVTFEGFPLDLAAAPVIGVTREGEPLEVDLPRGSYLLHLELEGRVPARLPVSVPLLPEQEQAGGLLAGRLLEPSEVPPGFVPVPAGWFPCGGDPEVDASLPAGREHVGDFFIGRQEVTVREYLELVNAVVPPEASAGRASKLIPEYRLEPMFEVDTAAGKWVLKKHKGSEEFPVFGISVRVAEEYARWLTERHGGRWRFRLPADLEWEKAARGADRRAHVWGDYPVDSFCRCGRSVDTLAVAGSSPFDVSVYGVRDLAGSVSEPTSSRKEGSFLSTRGGNWYANTRYLIRAANRNGVLPDRTFQDQGVRLVAEAR